MMFTLAVFGVFTVMYTLVSVVGDTSNSGFLDSHLQAWPIYVTSFLIDFIFAVYTIYIRPELVEDQIGGSEVRNRSSSFLRDDADIHHIETAQKLDEITRQLEIIRESLSKSNEDEIMNEVPKRGHVQAPGIIEPQPHGLSI